MPLTKLMLSDWKGPAAISRFSIWRTGGLKARWLKPPPWTSMLKVAASSTPITSGPSADLTSIVALAALARKSINPAAKVHRRQILPVLTSPSP